MSTSQTTTMMPLSSSPLKTTVVAAASAAKTLPINDLSVIQDMIDISADRLEGLRTQCATSATLTQQEIRSLETKLVRMFSELLLAKARLNERIPASGLPHTTGNELKQWLRVVGLSQESLNVCLTRLSTLEQLLEQSDEELKQILCNNPSYREEEVRRLTKAMQSLRKCKEFLAKSCNDLMATTKQEHKQELTENLFWDSWDRHHHHHHHHHHRGSMGNIGITASPRSNRMAGTGKQSKQQQQQQVNNEHSYKSNSSSQQTADDVSSMQGSTLTLTLTPSPPNSPFLPTTLNNFSVLSGSAGGSLNGTPQRGKPAGTPPPSKKHQTLLGNAQNLTPTHVSCYNNQQQQDYNSSNLPLTKTKSNESQYQYQEASTPTSIISSGTGNTGSNCSTISRSRLHTDPSPDSHSSASSDIFMPEHNNNPHNLQVPRSPGTPNVSHVMAHAISHRFTKHTFMISTCDLCQKPMFSGLKCKECKYRCHKDCESNVPPSCGLPAAFVNEFKKTLLNNTAVNASPNLSTISKNRAALIRRQLPAANANNASNTQQQYMPCESSSPASSCNSSSPSSPALFNLPTQQQQGMHIMMANTAAMSSSAGGSSSTSSNMQSTPSSYHKNASQFNFPDVTITSNCNQAAGGTTQTLISGSEHEHANEQQQQQQTNEMPANSTEQQQATTVLCNTITVYSSNCNSVTSSSNTMSNSVTNSITSTGTFYPRKLSSAGVDKRVPFSNNELSDTHKSNDSDKTVSLSGSTSASTDSDRTPQRLDSTEDGDSGNWPRQNSLSLKEWDIPYSDLHLMEKIGQGRFGTVYRALWHGDVAVKFLKADYLDDERTLEAFKLEVANFKKTRHENLVLFMGACMNPPFLAIVTSLCKGNTLYTYIHSRRDKFTINKTTMVAQQISQGMGYLHARGIIHKDLRTKNIFLENGKVIITDFGLFSSTKLLYCDLGLGIPSGWLCYLAPELMLALMPKKPSDEILPFSTASDVYSFGTVWYELLCGEFPFKSQPPEPIIWQVGRGMKQTLANLQTSRDVKDILMLCWAFLSDDRPDFSKLLTLLERLPKKRLARSPSHPVQLSRSAESVF